MLIRILTLLVLLSTGLSGAPVSLVILHTNDIHDHVRPGDRGRGGLPYVAGYVQAVRAVEPAVLLVDAGDVTEKGDLVAFRRHGRITYEMMRRMNYDAVTIGNHDFDDVTLADIKDFEKALGQPLLNLNIRRPDGSAQFQPSRMVERGGLRIGLIGLIVPRKADRGGLDAAASGRALSDEARWLRSLGAQLIVAVCHESVDDCAAWARLAPEVHVFVSGHSHEELSAPRVVPETGALIVQAGHYAEWVGRLEIDFDPQTGRIVRHQGRLVPMDHDAVTPDAAMLAWVREQERKFAPEANDLVFDNPAPMDGFSLARIAADGLRRLTGADVAFCHPYQIIRDELPAGPVDVNQVFKTGGQRGHDCISVELSGAEIERYINLLYTMQGEPPEWSGCRVAKEEDAAHVSYRTDLEPAHRYRVVMPKLEWETRYLKLARKAAKAFPDHATAAEAAIVMPVAAGYTEAVVASTRNTLQAGGTVQAMADAIARERVLTKQAAETGR
ncbi:MAG: bifunctional metallophosphatase/5'-nucleotidase [Opitutaceae bacterium]|nr:bifunctional metallophosphatase/5'-nucleotidase [Opitutaceae bacterium]